MSRKSTSEFSKSKQFKNSNEWEFDWPNSADYNFNYYHLLSGSETSGIGKNTDPNARIAIVGAGIAGLTAARELFRSGYRNIDIYEASERIGGRLYSIPADNQHVCYEYGAMRIPFFPEPGSKNSLTDFYCTEFGIQTQPFPNPGSSVADTGIFMHEGYGAIPDMSRKPIMDLWNKEDSLPPVKILQQVHKKWSHFASMIQEVVAPIYAQGGETWSNYWQKMVKHYWDKDFADLVYDPAIDSYDENNPGFFGGLGMNEEEASVFYVIGAGDGGWGAFFYVGSLYPIRTLIFGFGTNHQVIQGRFDNAGEHTAGPHTNEKITDSIGNEIPSPHYLGVQSIAESMLFLPVSSDEVDNISLYEAMHRDDYDINLFLKSPARVIMNANPRVFIGSDVAGKYYDGAFLTSPTWALQMSIDFVGFEPNVLPFSVVNSIKISHWITSCKVFYPLKECYWEESDIPQLMMTDSFIQGVYGYKIETETIKDEPGLLLVSYTWEDDAAKMLSVEDDQELARKCLFELDRILLKSENIKRKISPYVDMSKPMVIHWAKKPTYAGCSKLYRERMWNENYSLYSYNQKYSGKSGLYFAGDGYSLESGWFEPAMRTAIDGVIQFLKNNGGEFNKYFNPDKDYPNITDWSPEEYIEKA